MAKRMLIDATHAEETRVVVVNGTRLEQLDVESSSKKQLKGNIYLAKVIRVEPSLQAAFVDYGGNRHGFLAFSEIHPDYYQIPPEDIEAFKQAQGEDDDPDDDDVAAAEADDLSDTTSADAADGADGDVGDDDGVDQDDTITEIGGGLSGDSDDDNGENTEAAPKRERRRSTRRPMRQYKIQEVIRRKQLMLVQVVKEERGNKGAALTTYLSLAGRYCVLMPNTARGGGVSRKITSVADRKRLKQIMANLQVPSSMAVILRTAGQQRQAEEIRRDYCYLMRTWGQIRDVTFESRAPALIHEEANLIKRAIRDIYSSDIEEVLVDGENGYRLAKDFMKLLTPSHAKYVLPYEDASMPLFHRYQVDNQLDAMHSPTVNLRSGGYIVINQTEALVAIDVNSGRATKERHIEETALNTNLEAAEEIARQLRLRDMAGLVVIDFIDMEEQRNNAAVERKLKEALKQDRARIQMGRISHFGLLEMSRQRLRPSLMETSFETCPHCKGSGMVRSVESAAVHILRVIEEEGVRRRSAEINISVATPIALYILNNKRDTLADIERRYGLRVYLRGDDTLISPDYRMERTKADPRPDPEPVEEIAVAPSHEGTSESASSDDDSSDNSDSRKRRKRRKRRRRGEENDESVSQNDDQDEDNASDASSDGDDGSASDETSDGDGDTDGDSGDGRDNKRRRRSRRGGRRRRRGDTSENAARDDEGTSEGTEQENAADSAVTAEAADDQAAPAEATNTGAEAADADDESNNGRSRRRRRVRRTGSSVDEAANTNEAADDQAAKGESNIDAEDKAPAEAPQADAAPLAAEEQTAEGQAPVADASVTDAPEAEAPAPEASAPEVLAADAKTEAADAAVAVAEEAPQGETEAPLEVANDVAPAHSDAPAAAPAAAELEVAVIVEKPVEIIGAAGEEAAPPRKRGWWSR